MIFASVGFGLRVRLAGWRKRRRSERMTCLRPRTCPVSGTCLWDVLRGRRRRLSSCTRGMPTMISLIRGGDRRERSKRKPPLRKLSRHFGRWPWMAALVAVSGGGKIGRQRGRPAELSSSCLATGRVPAMPVDCCHHKRLRHGNGRSVPRRRSSLGRSGRTLGRPRSGSGRRARHCYCESSSRSGSSGRWHGWSEMLDGISG